MRVLYDVYHSRISGHNLHCLIGQYATRYNIYFTFTMEGRLIQLILLYIWFVVVFGSKSQSEGNILGARKLCRAAMALNIIGCILGCVAWGFFIWFLIAMRNEYIR